jgi:NADH:ubiquinone oxidoreductase subunit K
MLPGSDEAGEYNVRRRRFGWAWLGLAGTLALHVTDEALTGFLDVYNPVVRAVRERYPFVRLPVFTFHEWIIGLAVAVVLLFCVSPWAFRGRRWVVLVAMPLSLLMTANALAHLGSSLYLGRLMPGVYSSPVLLAASLFVFVSARAVWISRKQP